MAKPIGTLGTIDSLTIGTRVFVDLDNLIVLSAAGYAGSNYICTARLANATSGYQVTSGKTLRIDATQFYIDQVYTVTLAFRMFYSDNDVGFATAGTTTNEVVYNDGGTGTYARSLFPVENPQSQVAYKYPFFSVPSGKYPGCAHGGASLNWSGMLFGYES